jgi:cytidylate kinase
MESAPALFLITGPMAAGKTTVARLLAGRVPRGVHVEGDVFRRSIVSGRREMTPEPSAEALAQLNLRYRLAAGAADAYVDAGFTVALEDVVIGAALLDYITMIQTAPLYVFVLAPSLAAIRAREAGRNEKGYARWPVDQLYESFVATTPRVGLWIDTTDHTADETVATILTEATPVA